MKKVLFSILVVSSLLLAEVVISPNMNLPVPIVGQTTGPEWAQDINSCMGAIDSHDHTPGHGVQISSQAILINSDFPLNNNSLTEAKSVQFEAQPSFSSTQAIYVISPDLIYNDGNGNVIRITQNGSVSGASGTITGLPSGTASASYQSVGGTFQFQSATNTPANGSFASVLLAQQTTNPNTVTLKSPNSLASSYNVTFPTSVPAFASLLSMSTSGVLSTVAYKAPTVQKFTSGSGTYTTPTNPSPLYIIVELVGPGGGGGAQNTDDGDPGSGATTFGTGLLSGGPGINGQENSNSAGGAGGAASITGVSFSGIAIAGGEGQPSTSSAGVGETPPGGNGGSSAYGGAGGGGAGNATGAAGGNAAANSGSGGGGGSGVSGVGGGGGGGAGGYVKAMSVSTLSSNYAYSVGTGGAGGTAGGKAGGNGADGQIIVYEFYQ